MHFQSVLAYNQSILPQSPRDEFPKTSERRTVKADSIGGMSAGQYLLYQKHNDILDLLQTC